MSRLPTRYNWGKQIEDEYPDLFRRLSDVYTDIALVLNETSKVAISPNPKIQGSIAANPPASSDFNRAFDIGDKYVRTDTDAVWVMTSRTTPEAVTWTAV